MIAVCDISDIAQGRLHETGSLRFLFIMPLCVRKHGRDRLPRRLESDRKSLTAIMHASGQTRGGENRDAD